MKDLGKIKRINSLIKDIESAQKIRFTEDRELMLEAFRLLKSKLEDNLEPSISDFQINQSRRKIR